MPSNINDPDTLLAELRALLTVKGAASDPIQLMQEWDRVSEAFEQLDGWLTSGRRLPEVWRLGQQQRFSAAKAALAQVFRELDGTVLDDPRKG